MGSDGAHSPPAYPYDGEKNTGPDKAVAAQSIPISDVQAGRLSFDSGKVDQTHRLLKSRHIQLIGIGGSIGTVLYVRPCAAPPHLVISCLL